MGGNGRNNGQEQPARWLIWSLGIGVLIGLLASGAILWIISQPRGEPVRLSTPPPPGNIQVHVTGAVIQPGIYELPYGSRVGAAVEAAGGFTDQADRESINLAAILEDGSQVRVAAIGEPTPTRSSGDANPGDLVNINTASAAELESLPEIGPVIAQNIIDYREANGPFASIEAIQDVPEIGPGKFEAIRNLITVSP